MQLTKKKKRTNTCRFLCTECVTTSIAANDVRNKCNRLNQFVWRFINRSVFFCTHPNETQSDVVTTTVSRQSSLQVLKKHAIHGCDLFCGWKICVGKCLILPTAVKLWNPYFHWPIYAALSFKQNRPGNHWAIFGFTDNSSPWKCLRISGFQSVGEWNRW